ncbi:hypothetical protein Kfla_1181 [Kribbella flavida DSM 17836]|uniref:Uncharacterized protein n=1 Tax=Kribbella flavida (strain DSM 17836 / JCM 10339 / NBRC 14399) TaxID=479435 RepID=D2Q2V4_KRIFD|nr:hypothetical protein Kfla_1181 [Kribbella flavida DSM 17836]
MVGLADGVVGRLVDALGPVDGAGGVLGAGVVRGAVGGVPAESSVTSEHPVSTPVSSTAATNRLTMSAR